MINRETFYPAIRPLFGGKIIQPQVQGLEALITEFERRQLTDIRWLAYILATVYHETAKTMQPIEEYGKGRGKDYGKKLKYGKGVGKRVPYSVPDQLFYGRGLTQNTWYENYDALTRAAVKQGKDWNFLQQPELLLQMEPSVWATFHAMTSGLYTGKALADYINPVKCDWKNARRVINGLDRAEDIAGYAITFYNALL
jgi:putative chitinase